ncbi:hypothetical protein NQZ68_014844 [Dissostichus eleginoides]|nr:hypothetical protein NQZ68_014844 [Dissostichus eleginoides]
MALQQREKDLGDHLKPIMAALQPPRNSVTDGDLIQFGVLERVKAISAGFRALGGAVCKQRKPQHVHIAQTGTHTQIRGGLSILPAAPWVICPVPSNLAELLRFHHCCRNHTERLVRLHASLGQLKPQNSVASGLGKHGVKGSQGHSLLVLNVEVICPITGPVGSEANPYTGSLGAGIAVKSDHSCSQGRIGVVTGVDGGSGAQVRVRSPLMGSCGREASFDQRLKKKKRRRGRRAAGRPEERKVKQGDQGWRCP